nr:hypothetical protein GCM10023233_32240 [Brevibacterium otitidis]
MLAQCGGLGDPFDEAALASTTVPVAAAVFTDDMFVPAELSPATAEKIAGTRLLVTNEYQHDGIRVDGARLLSKLISLLS